MRSRSPICPPVIYPLQMLNFHRRPSSQASFPSYTPATLLHLTCRCISLRLPALVGALDAKAPVHNSHPVLQCPSAIQHSIIIRVSARKLEPRRLKLAQAISGSHVASTV